MVNAAGKFFPTISNPGTAVSEAPEGMVWVSGRDFSMSAQDPPAMDKVGMQATADSRPIHRRQFLASFKGYPPRQKAAKPHNRSGLAVDDGTDRMTPDPEPDRCSLHLECFRPGVAAPCIDLSL